MKYRWNISEIDWTDYCARSENEMIENGDYVGCCRIGDLCFDIVLREYDEACTLDYDLYVGGVDSRYGYSVFSAMESGKYKSEDEVPDKECYPYDYYGGGSFDDSCIWMRFDEFKRIAERRFDEFIEDCSDEIKAKANEPLHIW